MIVIPSFSKEFVWQIQHDQEADRYYSITSTGNHSIWYNQYEDTPKQLKAEISVNEIDKETGELIKKLFQVAIMTVRHTSMKGNFGLDGTDYYFSSMNKSGTIYSPVPESKMHRLVKLCYELIEKTAKNEKLSEDIMKSIEQLISDIHINNH